jgi:uncharacterized protein (TIGR02001 family)
LGLSVAAPAAAQFAGSLGIESDYRLRGYSLTNDQPALTAQISYDHRSGAYLNVSGLAEIGRERRFLGVIAAAGYAKRVNERLTVDGGVLRYQLRGASGGRPGFEYTEVYAGAYAGRLSGRISYSPDYRRSGLSTVYAELEAGVEPASGWRLSGHLGLLTYLNSTYGYGAGAAQTDWRIAAARQLGRVELHTAVSGGAPSSYYGYRVHKTAVTAGASVSF